MGTGYHIKLAKLPPSVSEGPLQARIDALLERINDQMSTYREDSEISRFNRHQGPEWIPVSPETAQVVTLAIRVSELCNIEVKEVDLAACKIRINEGKGSKDRYVLFGKSFATALRTHIANNQKNRWLFQTRRASKYSTRRVQQIVKKVATRAQISEPEVSTHTLRHTFATSALQKGISLAALKKVSGTNISVQPQFTSI